MKDRGTLLGTNPLARMGLSQQRPGDRAKNSRTTRPHQFAENRMASAQIGRRRQWLDFYERLLDRFQMGQRRSLNHGEMVYKIPTFWAPDVHVKLGAWLLPMLLLQLTALQPANARPQHGEHPLMKANFHYHSPLGKQRLIRARNSLNPPSTGVVSSPIRVEKHQHPGMTLTKSRKTPSDRLPHYFYHRPSDQTSIDERVTEWHRGLKARFPSMATHTNQQFTHQTTVGLTVERIRKGNQGIRHNRLHVGTTRILRGNVPLGPRTHSTMVAQIIRSEGYPLGGPVGARPPRDGHHQRFLGNWEQSSKKETHHRRWNFASLWDPSSPPSFTLGHATLVSIGHRRRPTLVSIGAGPQHRFSVDQERRRHSVVPPGHAVGDLVGDPVGARPRWEVYYQRYWDNSRKEFLHEPHAGGGKSVSQKNPPSLPSFAFGRSGLFEHFFYDPFETRRNVSLHNTEWLPSFGEQTPFPSLPFPVLRGWINDSHANHHQDPVMTLGNSQTYLSALVSQSKTLRFPSVSFSNLVSRHAGLGHGFGRGDPSEAFVFHELKKRQPEKGFSPQIGSTTVSNRYFNFGAVWKQNTTPSASTHRVDQLAFNPKQPGSFPSSIAPPNRNLWKIGHALPRWGGVPQQMKLVLPWQIFSSLNQTSLIWKPKKPNPNGPSTIGAPNKAGFPGLHLTTTIFLQPRKFMAGLSKHWVSQFGEQPNLFQRAFEKDIKTTGCFDLAGSHKQFRNLLSQRNKTPRSEGSFSSTELLGNSIIFQPAKPPLANCPGHEKSPIFKLTSTKFTPMQSWTGDNPTGDLRIFTENFVTRFPQPQASKPTTFNYLPEPGTAPFVGDPVGARPRWEVYYQRYWDNSRKEFLHEPHAGGGKSVSQNPPPSLPSFAFGRSGLFEHFFYDPFETRRNVSLHNTEWLPSFGEQTPFPSLPFPVLRGWINDSHANHHQDPVMTLGNSQTYLSALVSQSKTLRFPSVSFSNLVRRHAGLGHGFGRGDHSEAFVFHELKKRQPEKGFSPQIGSTTVSNRYFNFGAVWKQNTTPSASTHRVDQLALNPKQPGSFPSSIAPPNRNLWKIGHALPRWGGVPQQMKLVLPWQIFSSLNQTSLIWKPKKPNPNGPSTFEKDIKTTGCFDLAGSHKQFRNLLSQRNKMPRSEGSFSSTEVLGNSIIFQPAKPPLANCPGHEKSPIFKLTSAKFTPMQSWTGDNPTGDLRIFTENFVTRFPQPQASKPTTFNYLPEPGTAPFVGDPVGARPRREVYYQRYWDNSRKEFLHEPHAGGGKSVSQKNPPSLPSFAFGRSGLFEHFFYDPFETRRNVSLHNTEWLPSFGEQTPFPSLPFPVLRGWINDSHANHHQDPVMTLGNSQTYLSALVSQSKTLRFPSVSFSNLVSRHAGLGHGFGRGDPSEAFVFHELKKRQPEKGFRPQIGSTTVSNRYFNFGAVWKQNTTPSASTHRVDQLALNPKQPGSIPSSIAPPNRNLWKIGHALPRWGGVPQQMKLVLPWQIFSSLNQTSLIWKPKKPNPNGPSTIGAPIKAGFPGLHLTTTIFLQPRKFMAGLSKHWVSQFGEQPNLFQRAFEKDIKTTGCFDLAGSHKQFRNLLSQRNKTPRSEGSFSSTEVLGNSIIFQPAKPPLANCPGHEKSPIFKLTSAKFTPMQSWTGDNPTGDLRTFTENFVTRFPQPQASKPTTFNYLPEPGTAPCFRATPRMGLGHVATTLDVWQALGSRTQAGSPSGKTNSYPQRRTALNRHRHFSTNEMSIGHVGYPSRVPPFSLRHLSLNNLRPIALESRHANIRAAFASWRAENHAHRLVSKRPMPPFSKSVATATTNYYSWPKVVQKTVSDGFLSPKSKGLFGSNLGQTQVKDSEPIKPTAVFSTLEAGPEREALVNLIQQEIQRQQPETSPLDHLDQNHMNQLCDSLYHQLERRLVRERERMGI